MTTYHIQGPKVTPAIQAELFNLLQPDLQVCLEHNETWTRRHWDYFPWTLSQAFRYDWNGEPTRDIIWQIAGMVSKPLFRVDVADGHNWTASRPAITEWITPLWRATGQPEDRIPNLKYAQTWRQGILDTPTRMATHRDTTFRAMIARANMPYTGDSVLTAVRNYYHLEV
jgi:hypothetical protein